METTVDRKLGSRIKKTQEGVREREAKYSEEGLEMELKVLMIGMDGVKAETFERGWTPFLKSLIDNGSRLMLKEDLISRGWSEIMTGKHAIETGALYEGPVADGTLTWTDKFKLGDIPGLGTRIKPLWQMLNERGYRVGVMNVPTTYPAPEVDGFFVSGGGGGGPVSQEAGAEQCHPKGLENWLHDMGYIVDERMPSLLAEKGLYAPTAFFDRLEEMNQKRTEAFIDLANRYETDFGFIVYRSPVTTETLLPPELEKRSAGQKGVNHDFIAAAESFYQKLDQKIESLVKAFPRAEVLLVSDHSMATCRFFVNANTFLVQKGLQIPSSGRRGLFDTIKSFKHLLPYSIKQRLKKNPRIKSAYQSMVTFDPSKTKAFSLTFSNGAHGIYVNDEHRFGGPVSESSVDEVADQIVSGFNAHTVSKQHGFLAYRRPDGNGEVASKFPDVVLDLPDGYQTSNRYSDFVTKTPLQSKALDLRDMKKDPRTVGKAHEPLVVCATGDWLVKAGERVSDLTVVYQHLLNALPPRSH